ncbi:hypothetical protein NDU88_012912 [Pleurodeles waltl]|uniref:Secreted protein n=1 Tax=Pleurodeles waltl TaxID=8319 RepID=A0AAV7R2V3_PLEWA|nr:hypothetical protein NDU88_012912 [Pleurodeles waltl]
MCVPVCAHVYRFPCALAHTLLMCVPAAAAQEIKRITALYVTSDVGAPPHPGPPPPPREAPCNQLDDNRVTRSARARDRPSNPARTSMKCLHDTGDTAKATSRQPQIAQRVTDKALESPSL